MIFFVTQKGFFTVLFSDLCNSNEQRLQWQNDFFQLAAIQNPLHQIANSNDEQQSNRQDLNASTCYENLQVMEASALTGEGIGALGQWLIKVSLQTAGNNK